jgi:hypothetical protein
MRRVHEYRALDALGYYLERWPRLLIGDRSISKLSGSLPDRSCADRRRSCLTRPILRSRSSILAHQQLVTQYARHQLMKIPKLMGGHRFPARVFRSHVLPASRASALQPKCAQLNTITSRNKMAKMVEKSPSNSEGHWRLVTPLARWRYSVAMTSFQDHPMFRKRRMRFVLMRSEE